MRRQRFVFLWHQTPADYYRESHFDLMFQDKDALRTWASKRLPNEGFESITVVELPRHRLAYLDYEGSLSKGRGTVRRVAAGRLEVLDCRDNRVVYRLSDSEMEGLLMLDRLEGTDWEMSWQSDFDL